MNALIDFDELENVRKNFSDEFDIVDRSLLIEFLEAIKKEFFSCYCQLHDDGTVWVLVDDCPIHGGTK